MHSYLACTGFSTPGLCSLSASPQFCYDIVQESLPAVSYTHLEYRAIVRGHFTPESGVITAPLGRKDSSIIERTVDFDHGEKAVTYYQFLEEKNGHSLVSLRLGTGRTHQIRIHMKYIGFPLVGDYL